MSATDNFDETLTRETQKLGKPAFETQAIYGRRSTDETHKVSMKATCNECGKALTVSGPDPIEVESDLTELVETHAEIHMEAE